MTRGLVTSSKYSPGNLTPEVLEKLFVGRDKLLSEILKRISASALGEEKHFLLLLGQRGIGKTHFLHLLHHRLTTGKRYSRARKRLTIAFLNEEEWGVASFLDLLITILRSASGESDSTLRQGIEELYSLYTKNPEAALERAETLLIRHVGDKALLVICENLIDLFHGLGDEGQKRWRAFIQEHPFWIILATTPAMFAGVQLQQSPFYGFFTIRNLDPLDFESAVTLLRQKALVDGQDDLAAFLLTATGRARARAIHHLAGGHHRVYVVMSEFLTKESLDELVDPFMRMVDDLTPYYQERIRALVSPQQRKIVEFLCRENAALPVKQVAERCLISQQTAAKQLTELVALGIVKKTIFGRETFCEMAEPLMRLCFEVKDNRNRHLTSFVDFLRRWFSSSELRRRFAELPALDEEERPVDRIHLEAAIEISENEKSQPFLDALDQEADRCYASRSFKQAADARLRIVAERGSLQDYADLIRVLGPAARTKDIMRYAEQAREKHSGKKLMRLVMAQALSAVGEKKKALAEIDRALARQPKVTKYLCLRGELLLSLGRYQEALENDLELLEIDPRHVHAYLVRTRAFSGLGRHGDAEKEARLAVERFPESRIAWFALVRALREAGAYEAALEALTQALSKYPRDWDFLRERVVILRRTGRFEDALQACGELRNLSPEDRWPAEQEISLLCGLHQFAEAEKRARDFLNTHTSRSVSRDLAHTLVRQRKAQEALPLIQRLLESAPADHELLMLQGEAFFRTGNHAEAVRSLGQLLDDPALPDSRRGAPLALKTLALLESRRDAEALAFIENNLPVVEAARELQWLHALVLTAVSGLHVGMEALLKGVGAGDEIEALGLDCSEMLRLEHGRRGPIALAREMAQITDGRSHELLAAGLSGMLRTVLKSLRKNEAEWAVALPRLKATLEGREDYQLPLAILNAALRFTQDGDQTALLDLPLEIRNLVTDTLGLAEDDQREKAK